MEITDVIRVKPSEFGIKEKIFQKPRGYGTLIRIKRNNLDMYFVRWDGTKSGQYYHKSFIDIL